MLDLEESLRLKLDERERLRDECFDIEIILHDIKREINAAKSHNNGSNQRHIEYYDQEEKRLLEQKKILENKKKQLTKDLQRAMDETRIH